MRTHPWARARQRLHDGLGPAGWAGRGALGGPAVAVVMVDVVNSAPEPAGTHRTYWPRVPPRVRTAREGVAWTLAVDADTYRPERET
nr:hypothetical protein OG546_09805 [Streptomyces antimycoticus]